MAQIQALLMISRGNTNMNVRALVEWRLANKEMISGDRKYFYRAKKDIWVVAGQITQQSS
ncbi:MAG: DNA-binding transcriptional regulator GbsR (MarR family) [Bacteroidia bacterium]|jgi:DNA-binding transcriptional regulator GbsR (MarR family)